MNTKIIIFIICQLISFSIFAQEFSIDGIYCGKNLFVLNPSVGEGFCVTEVRVNGIKTHDEVNSNSFEIDFSLMNIEKGMNVHVQIFHKTNCKPSIINPEILQKKPNLSIINAKVNRKGFLTWEVQSNFLEGLFVVEQFRWQKWVKVAEIKTEDTVNLRNYALEVSPNTAQNIFRIKFKDKHGNETISKEIKYTLPGKEIIIVNEKVKNRIVFTSVTMYEIIDETGNLIQNGNDKYIDTSALPKGKYFINYDNKTESFTKK
ncbi:MAG: hypothetical protein HXX18_00205 [Bacteroidetes bacterium]|nr:hypothetical protein [Bacteroidota bacterium]